MSESLPFTKMHGCGNDYVVVDAKTHLVADPTGLARRTTDRRRGVGADGLILVMPSDDADFRMRMFNVDGSEAEMCGNGLRCAARFVHERGWIGDRTHFTAETGAGVLGVEMHATAPDGTRDVTIDMGAPGLERSSLPMQGEGRAVEEALALDGETLRITAVSMGNPHAVTFVDAVASAPVTTLGPALETHAAFPERVNVEFVQVLGRNRIRQRTWERGCGETEACGTGACAAVVAGALTGRTDREVAVELNGGTLQVRWADDGQVYLRGPTVDVFEGRWPGEA